MRTSSSQLRELAKVCRANCLTLVIPLPVKPDGPPNPALLRGILQAAGEALQLRGATPQERSALLDSSRGLFEQMSSMPHRGGSLVAFIADGVCESIPIPRRVDPEIVVGDCFHPRAFMHLLRGAGDYCILCFSQNEVRLLEFQEGQSPVEIPLGIPASLNAFMLLEDREEHQQWHTTGGKDHSLISRACHGDGSWKDAERRELPNFIKAVAKAVRRKLQDRDVPLLLAGVASHVAALRRALGGMELAEEELAGCHDGKAPASLQALAEPLMQQRRLSVNAIRASKVAEKLGLRAIVDFPEIQQAATRGQVLALFIDMERTIWQANAGGQVAQLDAVIRDVLRHDGLLVPVPPGTLPDSASLMASLRFPIAREAVEPHSYIHGQAGSYGAC